MRRVFGGMAAVSLSLAAALGGTLAWESDQISGPNAVNVGSLQWILGYTPVSEECSVDDGPLLQCPTPIGPNGTTVLIGHVSIQNLGDFTLSLPQWVFGPDESQDNIALGEVIIESVVTEDAGNHAACDAYNFYGVVRNTSWDDEVEPGETESFAGAVEMHVDDDAPEACIGATVNYLVRVVVQTAGNGDPE